MRATIFPPKIRIAQDICKVRSLQLSQWLLKPRIWNGASNFQMWTGIDDTILIGSRTVLNAMTSFEILLGCLPRRDILGINGLLRSQQLRQRWRLAETRPEADIADSQKPDYAGRHCANHSFRNAWEFPGGSSGYIAASSLLSSTRKISVDDKSRREEVTLPVGSELRRTVLAWRKMPTNSSSRFV